jgi:poly-gamma-glutamate biosynthesis protein PgsC/CapC
LNDIIIIGIILSILYYELTEISPGGIVVPAYIAIYINQPEKVLSTILISIFTILVVNFISKYMILYGKRKFGVMVIISFLIRLIFNGSFGFISMFSSLFVSSIGYLIPGIIASDLDRQGYVKTFSSMMIVASLTKLIQILIDNGVQL